MSALHLYRADDQPATRYVDRHMEPPLTFTCRRRRLWWTDCCRRRRWAAYVRVQVYYDTIYRICASGYGCRRH